MDNSPMFDGWSGCHPVINLVYYMLVIGVAVFFMHPVFLAIGLISAGLHLVTLRGKKGVFVLFTCLPLALLSIVLNPLFNHQGATMLFYLRNGNPVTLEAVWYGIGAGLMMITVIGWFAAFHQVMTADRIMYLFGKSIPAFSLLFSMVLRFVPRFTQQMKKVAKAQQCLGRDVSQGNLITRIQNGLRIFSITVTWALENSVDTADSMKSRGYGLRGRTSFSLYRMDGRDRCILVILLAGIVMLLYELFHGWISILYYPMFTMNGLDLKAVITYLTFALISLLPVIVNGKEELKWRYLQSKI